MLEAIREDHPKERIVMVILPGTGGELLTEAGSRDIFEDVYDEMEADLVADGEPFFRPSLSHWVPASASGERSTCWRVTVTTTLVQMLMYGKEASNRKQEIDRQHYTIPNQRPKDKHCGKI